MYLIASKEGLPKELVCIEVEYTRSVPSTLSCHQNIWWSFCLEALAHSSTGGGRHVGQSFYFVANRTFLRRSVFIFLEFHVSGNLLHPPLFSSDKTILET